MRECTVRMGQMVSVPPSFPGCLDTKRIGTVVYIHPENRFFTLQFNCKHGSYRESFFMK